jgi:hypothetical protein
MILTLPVDRLTDHDRYIAEQYLKTTPHVDGVEYDSGAESLRIEHDGTLTEAKLREECATAGFSLTDETPSPSSILGAVSVYTP